MRYSKIRKMDIANGEGVRVSIFFQGCAFHCDECFNPETWDFNGGLEFTDEVINHILDLASPNHISGLSILGGEPMHPKNIEGTTKLAKDFKEKYQDKTIWCWTGFKYEDIKDKEVFNYIDVLIDGQFQKDKFDSTLKWRGSSNQRVIDIKKTKDKAKLVLYESNIFKF